MKSYNNIPKEYEQSVFSISHRIHLFQKKLGYPPSNVV